MKKTIWKFPFEVTDEIKIRMPKGAEILTVEAQGSSPCIWALVDPDASMEVVTFRVYGTGHPVETMNIEEHVGTFQLEGGAFVGHLFKAAT